MFDVTNCAVTLDMVVILFGILGICILWSHYKTALFIAYLSFMYWVYTLYQSDLLQLIGQDAFYWTGAAAVALGSIMLAIMNQIPGRR